MLRNGCRDRRTVGSGNSGFTLIELVVVIAILAILIAIVVHMHSGYMRKTSNSAVKAELETVAKAVQIANAGGGAVSKIMVEPDGTLVIEGDLKDDFYDNFSRYYFACKRSNKVSYIIVEGTCGEFEKKEVYSPRITLLCFETLVSESDYENGAVWTVDGGWTALGDG